MKAKRARELGARVAALVGAEQPAKAYALLAPLLAQRTLFATLRRIAQRWGPGR